MSLLGYTVCQRCGVPVLDLIAYKTDGLCPHHHRERVTAALDGFELRGRQMRLVLPQAKPKSAGVKAKNTVKTKRRRSDPERRRLEHLRDRAQRRALRRLRNLFPEVFDILLAEERERSGLEAWTIDMALRPGTTEATLEIVEKYHRRDGASRRRNPASDDEETTPG